MSATPHLAADLSAVMARTLVDFHPHSTIIIDGTAPSRKLLRDKLTAIRAAGWQCADPTAEDGQAWILAHRDNGKRTVAIGWRRSMKPDIHLGVLFDRSTDPGTVAIMLDRFSQVTGHAWRGTPASTAHAGIRLTWGNTPSQPLWNNPRKASGRAVGPLTWSRPLTKLEQSWGWVHTFDTHASYLAAAGNAELAWSGLHDTGARDFDKHLPGYWLLRVSDRVLEWPTDGRPPLIDRRRIIDVTTGLRPTESTRRDDMAIEITTPYAELLGELGDPLDVLDSFTAAERYRSGGRASHRVLRGWADQLRESRRVAAELPPALRGPIDTAIKRLYKDAVGGFQSRVNMRINRADWGHTVVDLALANLWRTMIRVHASQGVWPCGVATDSLSYADGAAAPQARGATLHYGPWAHTLTDELRVSRCATGCGCTGEDGLMPVAVELPGPLGSMRHESTTTAEAWYEATAGVR